MPKRCHNERLLDARHYPYADGSDDCCIRAGLVVEYYCLPRLGQGDRFGADVKTTAAGTFLPCRLPLGLVRKLGRNCQCPRGALTFSNGGQTVRGRLASSQQPVTRISGLRDLASFPNQSLFAFCRGRDLGSGRLAPAFYF